MLRWLVAVAVVNGHCSGVEGRCGGGRKGGSAVPVTAVEQRREGRRSQRDLNVVWQSRRSTRVADGHLPGNSRAILQSSRDVVGEVGVDGREDIDVRRDGADHRKQVDGGLKGPGKYAGSRKEHVADGGFGEVEGGCWAGALDDLEVERIEDGADEFSLGRRDVGPE